MCHSKRINKIKDECSFWVGKVKPMWKCLKLLFLLMSSKRANPVVAERLVVV